MAITIMGSFLVTKVDGAKPSVREGRSMRQPKRPPKSTTRPLPVLAEIRSRLSGPGGLYNLGDALGFGSGLLIAYLGRRDSPTPWTTFNRSECDMWRESGRRRRQ